MSAGENKVNASVGERGEGANEVNGLTAANGTGVFSKPDNAVSSASGSTVDYSNQENMVYVSPQGMPYQYSPFASVDGSWGATGQYDPSLLAALQFNVMQQPFYFPGAGDIWGQDTGNVLMNYSLLSPVSLDQSQPVQNTSEILTETSTPAQPAPAVMDNSGLAGSFSGLMLNGGVPGVMAVGPTNVLPAVPVENVVTPAVGIPVPVQNTAPQPEKPKSWAAIASQPAKPRPPKPPPQPEPQVVETPPSTRKPAPRSSVNSQSKPTASAGASNGKQGPRKTTQGGPQATTTARTANKGHQSELVGKLLSENKYNPTDFAMNLTNARFFVIKSYAEDDIHRSIKYSIWTSTEHGNRRLNQAFQEQQKVKANVYLLYSVNGSGHFCGVAQMTSEVDTNTSTGVWAQDKWKGRFDVKWIYVKDVPNSHLRHIRLENNENKPVTNSRDTQEVPLPKAKQVMKLIHTYAHTTSIFDDFDHYEKKQEEESGKPTHS